MKAYIATRLENHKSHNMVRDALAEVGVSMSYDWTLHGPVWREGGERIREVSANEINGVRDADFIVVILPGGRGTHAELGAALALGKTVYLLAECLESRRMLEVCPETCAFYWHTNCIRTYGIHHLMNYVTTCEIAKAVKKAIHSMEGAPA